MKQTLLRLQLCVVVLLLTSMPALAEVLTGYCGKNATYSLDTETGLIKIEGSGTMDDYSPSLSIRSPWNSYKDAITEVQVSSGITRIGDHAFNECTNLKTISLPETLTSIGSWAFGYCI